MLRPLRKTDPGRTTPQQEAKNLLFLCRKTLLTPDSARSLIKITEKEKKEIERVWGATVSKTAIEYRAKVLELFELLLLEEVRG